MTGLTHIFRALIVLAVVVCGGCSETTLPQASGKGSIDAINAISDAPDLIFLIEEQQLGTLVIEQAAFIDERILWTSSTDALWASDPDGRDFISHA